MLKSPRRPVAGITALPFAGSMIRLGSNLAELEIGKGRHMNRDDYDMTDTLAGIAWAFALALATGAVIVASSV